MKGAVVVFKKNELEIRTQFVDSETVVWFDGPKALVEVLGDGFKIQDDLVLEGLCMLEDLWEKSKWGGKVTSISLEEIVKIFRKI